MAVHQYWRLLFPDGEGSGGNLGLSEIQLRDTAMGPNLATTYGSAYASSYYGGGYEPGNAIDGNNSSDWVSAGAAVGSWWGYDFGVGNEKEIVQVVLRPMNAYPNAGPKISVEVQYSDDGSSWTTAWSFTPPTWVSGTEFTDPPAPPGYYPLRVSSLGMDAYSEANGNMVPLRVSSLGMDAYTENIPDVIVRISSLGIEAYVSIMEGQQTSLSIV